MKTPTRGEAYLLMVQVPPTQDNLAGEQVGRIRLLPNTSGLCFAGRVRETPRAAVLAAGLTIEPTSWCIRRHGGDHNPNVKAHKARRDLKLAELEIRDSGHAASPLLAMGEAWSISGETEQAIGCFRQALSHCARGSTDMLEAYYGTLAAYDSQAQAHDVQIQTCLEALEIFPFDAQLLCAIASYMQNRGRVDLANRAYRSAVTHGQINLETWHLTSLREVAVTCLSLSLEFLNQDDEARRVLDKALAGGGDSLRLRRRLIDLHVKHDRRKEALDQVARLPADTPSSMACGSRSAGRAWRPRKIGVRPARFCKRPMKPVAATCSACGGWRRR